MKSNWLQRSGAPILAALSIFYGLDCWADESDRRQLDAHVHGAATMNVAIEGKSLYLEMTSPAIDIVGFEHQPRTAAQRAAIGRAMKILEQDLFVPSAAAGCTLLNATVATELSADEEHGHTEEAHARGGEESEEVHSEFTGTYRFECARPQQLRQIGVNLFTVFPSLEEIEAQVLTNSGQTAVELTPTQPNLRL